MTGSYELAGGLGGLYGNQAYATDGGVGSYDVLQQTWP